VRWLLCREIFGIGGDAVMAVMVRGHFTCALAFPKTPVQTAFRILRLLMPHVVKSVKLRYISAYIIIIVSYFGSLLQLGEPTVY
jgi:hypothetical protein